MGGYYTLSEVYAQLDNMHTKYPNLITAKEQIGTTIEDRPIYVVKISDNPDVDEDEPEVFYNALTHAREPMGMEVTIYYMYYLLENYNTDSTVKYLVDNREMYFEPVVNPDGYYYNQTTNPTGGGSWRKNRRNNGGSYGVDLNRNFGPEAYWSYANLGSSTTPSNIIYRGTAPFSEPETQAIRDFLLSHHIKTAFNYHSYGGDLPYPYTASESQTSDTGIFKEWATDIISSNAYASGLSIETLAYEIRGDVLDYMYDGDIAGNGGNIFSFLPEVGFDATFWPNQSRILPISQENVFPNEYIAFVAGGYADVSSYSVSDEYIDPAENIRMSITVKNKGRGSMEAVNATLSTTSSYVTINDTTEGVGALESQTSQTSSDAFNFTISESAPLGTQIDFVLTLKSGNSTISTKNITYYVASPKLIFSDTCSNMDNWTMASDSLVLWETTTTSYHTAPSSCTDSKNGNYGLPLDTTMTSTNAIDLTGYTSPRLSFWTKYDIFSKYIDARVQISTNNGGTWTNLTGLYTTTGTNLEQSI
jgi:carboxypeptidase T